MSARYNLYRTVNHMSLLDSARAMADRASAQEAGLTIDDAYDALATVGFARDVNSLARGPLMPGRDEPAAHMSPTSLFGAASSIDTLLSHGDEEQARSAATFTVELAATLDEGIETEAKRGILASVLGIELPSDTPVAQQLVEQRLLPDADLEEQIALSAMITLSARTVEQAA